MNLVKSEIDSCGSLYTASQFTILQNAYNDLKTSLMSTAVSTMPEWFLPWYELEIDGANYVAEGAFGEVYRAKWLESEVIVKQVKLTNSTKLGYKRDMFVREVGVWFGLSHPHVVRLFGACHVGMPLFVCEYASNGSLNEFLCEYPTEIWQKLYEAALGVQYLHSRDIIHGDLKCNNIVVGGDNKAKVTDFGLSSANIVTGAYNWVAPECLERGPSELSFASDIYALGMCIVEALRIVEKTITNNKDCVSPPLPWGNLNNYVVKYHVTNLKKLPRRPYFCTHEWGLVERMCAYDPKERIKVSTVVDILAALASAERDQSPELTEPELGRISQQQIEKMKSLCCLQQQQNPGNACQQETWSTNQVVLRSVYGLLWDRFQNLCVMASVQSRRLQPIFERALISTSNLELCPNTLTGFTQMAMDGYGLHRELDKVIKAHFWPVDFTIGGLHDWKSKCKTTICTSAPGSDGY
ncbi:Serine/threonine protein kinase [Phytophthora megakarya]|uniref:Serine/threonine protein kinase n=1 Tax=Phytophthora megakarya TaxID=4795 RepID=A0A225WSL2_9STRA|nr:Serine/threonine protein kinase [Phytophthora megakarya]